MSGIKSKDQFKVLLVYPNLSMLLSPPLSIGIFTSLLKQEGYQVDLFDVTAYVGEGTSVQAEGTFVGDEMNTLRADKEDEEEKDGTAFQEKPTDQLMQEMGQSRAYSFEEDLGVESKTGLFSDFRKKVESFKPDLILTSIVEDTFLQAVKLVSVIQDLNIPMLHGGVFITFAPEVALKYPGFELLGIGEGEQIVLDVADRLRKGLSCDDVPGVWIKKKDGSIIKNPRGDLFDFTRVIPDFSLFEEARFMRPMGGRFFKAVPIESYRGCPYTCAYCNSPVQNSLSKDAGLGTFFRRAPVNRVRDYIAKVVEQIQPTFIRFVDDSFLARPTKEIEAFCEMYSEFKIPFWFNTRPENVTAEILKMLKEVNCYRMSYGIECGNEAFRTQKLQRTIKNEKLIKKFEIIAAGGIPYSVNSMIGFPGETRDLIFETIELNRQIPAYDALTVSVFAPYHGTHLRDEAIEKGYINSDLIVYNLHHSTLKMPQLSIEEIDGLLRTFPLYVHFDKSFWPEINKAEQFDEEGNALFKKYSDQYQSEAFALDQDAKMEAYKKVSGAVSCASDSQDSFLVK